MKFIKKHLYTILSFICPLLVIGIVYYIKEVTPFGVKSLLEIDFFHQYSPMLKELLRRITTGQSLIYSFNMGLGLPLFRNFFNYLSSPLNIIILLFNDKNILTSFSIIIALKAVLSCITMSIFLKNKFSKNYAFIALSLLYSFSAYYIAYHWNIMWLDGMYMIPLIALGIEKLIDKRKPLLYIISLSLALITNYFIGYMLCIFSVLYFITYYLSNYSIKDFKKFKKTLIDFIISSLLVGGLCAFFFIPMYTSLKSISATKDTMPSSQYYSFTLAELLFKHYSGVESTVLSSGVTNAPNISLGIISVALLFMFWINPDIKLRVKLSYSILLLFMIISFLGAKLDFIWHAFHVPNDLPYRYSFIYTFILATICAYSIKHIKSIKAYIPFIIYVILMIPLIHRFDSLHISDEMITINIIVLTTSLIIFILNKYFKKFNFIWIPLLIIILMVDTTYSIKNNWDITSEVKNMYTDYDSVLNSLEFISDNNESPYRVDRDYILTFNDPSWYGYMGVTNFSSMTYESIAKLMHKLGMPGNEINSHYFKTNTPIWNMMFNLKYLLSKSKPDYYQIFDYVDSYIIYENSYTLGLMYGVNEDIKDWNLNQDNSFEVQNDFINKSTGIDNVLEKVDLIPKEVLFEENKTIVKYSIDCLQNCYLYSDKKDLDLILVNKNLYHTNNDFAYIFNYTDILSDSIDYNENYIIDLPNEEKLTLLVSYNTNSINNNIYLYRVNQDKLDESYSKLEKNKINITNFKEHFIEANLYFNENKSVYTSIPYDHGWKVYVDNKKINTYKIGDALLGFDISSGTHHIKLKYEIPYLKISLLISIISTILLIIYLKREH